MDAACLRVKFTPLLQNICKDRSKCCLEIVPEIVCLKNLDKLQWNRGDHSIEYKIPITYKLTLQRREITKNTDKNCDENEIKKIYHSCVDLLIPSSSLDMNLASGDVTKVISDTIVLNKMSTSVNNANSLYDTTSYCLSPTSKDSKRQITHCQTEETVGTIYGTTSNCISSTRNVLERKVTYSQTIEAVETIATTCSQKTITKSYPEVIEPNVQIIQVINEDTGNGQFYLNDKATNTNCKSLTQSTSTLIRCHTYTDYSLEHKRKLSITPVYSVNTEDCSLIENKCVISKEITFCVHKPKSYNHYKALEENITNANDDCKPIDAVTPYFHRAKARVLPELRVANFVQKMEQEIFPLKIMLNEMICKCASLGLDGVEVGLSRSPLRKSVLNIENKTKKQCCKKCNRVVYSMVFDG